jgi:DNA integrity scanning protein DisA with diadenylate cyclase activity
MFEKICDMIHRCGSDVLEQTIQLAVEIAREGREGRKVGTLLSEMKTMS